MIFPWQGRQLLCSTFKRRRHRESEGWVAMQLVLEWEGTLCFAPVLMWISTLCWCQSSLLLLTMPLYWQSLLPPQNFVTRWLFLEVSETGTHIQPFNSPVGQEFFWSPFQWFPSCSSPHLRPSIKSKNHADVRGTKGKNHRSKGLSRERGVRELEKDAAATHPGCGDTDSDVKPQAPEYSGISSARKCLISLLPSK